MAEEGLWVLPKPDDAVTPVRFLPSSAESVIRDSEG
jgi:hypothetical protein